MALVRGYGLVCYGADGHTINFEGGHGDALDDVTDACGLDNESYLNTLRADPPEIARLLEANA